VSPHITSTVPYYFVEVCTADGYYAQEGKVPQTDISEVCLDHSFSYMLKFICILCYKYIRKYYVMPRAGAKQRKQGLILEILMFLIHHRVPQLDGTK